MSSLNKYSHPVFVPNQALTSSRLNEIHNFLDAQDKNSRIHLIGTGIACGLIHHYSEQKGEINIQDGYGVCSEGYLFGLPCGEHVYKQYKDYSDPSANSPFVNNSGEPVPVYQLTNNPDDESVAKLPAGSDELVIGLYLQSVKEVNKPCIGNDCNDLGEDVRLELIPILIPIDSLKAMGKNGPFNCFEPDEIMLGHPGSLTGGVPLSQIGSSIELRKAIQLQLGKDIDRFSRYWGEALKHYGPILKTTFRDQFRVTNAFERLVDLNLPNLTSVDFLDRIQYAHDFLRDLFHALQEFVEAAWYFRKTCCDIPTSAHPRFLLLGQVDPGEEWEFESYRHFYRESPALDRQNKDFLKLRILFKRIVHLIEHYQPEGVREGAVPIRITPSKGSHSALGDRALPYYYSLKSGSLPKFWNPETGLRGKQGTLLGHQFAATPYESPFFNRSPLIYDHIEYPFLRIEGHIGKGIDFVKKELESLRRRFNLPFDVLALSINQNSQVLRHREVCTDRTLIGIYLGARDEMIFLLKGLKNYFESFDKNSNSCYSELSNEFIPDLPKRSGRLGVSQTRAGKKLDLSGIADEVDEIVELLPIRFDDFDFREFIDSYQKLVQRLLTLKVAIYDLIRAIAQNRIYRYSTSAVIHLIYFLREPLSYLDGVIKETVYLRLARSFFQWETALNIRSTASLANFSRQNPGMVHMAGVPKGGTFIVVYDENQLVTDKVGAEDSQGLAKVIMDFALPHQCCESCEALDLSAVVLPPEVLKFIIVDVEPSGTVVIDLPLEDLQGEVARPIPQGKREDSHVYSQENQGGKDNPQKKRERVPDVPYSDGGAGAQKDAFRLTLDKQLDPQYGVLRLVQGRANKLPLLEYQAGPNRPNSGFEMMTVGIEDLVSGEVTNTQIMVVYKEPCLPFLFAKDLHLSTNNQTALTFDVLSEVLQDSVDLSIPGGQSTVGTVQILEVSGGSGSQQKQILYRPDSNFTGIDTFEYELSKGGDKAIGTVTVSVSEGSTLESPKPLLIPFDRQKPPVVYVPGTAIKRAEVKLVDVSDSALGTLVIDDANSGKIKFGQVSGNAGVISSDSVTYIIERETDGARATGVINFYQPLIAIEGGTSETS